MRFNHQEDGGYSLSDWRSLLEDLRAAALSRFEREEEEERERGWGGGAAAVREEFRCFADLALRACVEADLPEHLELVLEWVDPVARHLRVDAASAVKRNSKAMVRACRRGDWELVEALYRSGFRVRSALSEAASDEEQKSKRGGGGERGDEVDASAMEFAEDFDLIAELRLMEASTRPVYLIVEARSSDGDAVGAAFSHLHTCRQLSGTLKAFSNKLDGIRDTLFAFTLRMLDLCNGRGQVEAFLGRDDDIDGLSVRDESSMPRIYQAIQLGHKDFVTHDSSQQHIRRVFYGRRDESFK